MSHLPLRRRHVLQLMSGTALLPLLGTGIALAQPRAAARLIILSDLHSAYERSARLLAAIEAEIAASDVPAAILINGDVFELGNVVATRSAAVIDWALLSRLAALAPTVLNIGNHEPDIDTDLAVIVEKARAAGLVILSNIIDTRTGAPFTDAAATLDLDGTPLRVVGIATNAINTYPAATREIMDIPDPAAWAQDNLSDALGATGFPIVLSHAGVTPDRAILPLVPAGGLIVGGHDHIILDHDEAGTRYIHTGSWSSLFTVATIADNAIASVERRQIALDAPADAELEALITETLAAHLTAEELAIVGTSPEAMTVAESARFVATAMADAVDADYGFIGHTTFGTGFPAGEFSLYAFNSIVRFDGSLRVAEIDAATLADILTRANQDGDIPLASRTGDFLYAAATNSARKDTYRIAVNDWGATNQLSYFGRDDLVFEDVADLRVKALTLAAMQRN